MSMPLLAPCAWPARAAAPDRIVLRRPQGAEIRACRMLLPEWAPGTPWGEVRLLVCEAAYEVIGAVAATPCRDDQGEASLRIALQIVPPRRRQGFAARMIEQVKQEASRSGFSSLCIWRDADADEAGLAFLESEGFSLHDTETRFEVSLPAFTACLTPLHDWLKARGSLPRDIRFVPLGEAPLDELARLHIAHIGGSFDHVRANLEALAVGPLAPAQPVMTVGGMLAGLMIVTADGEHGHIAAKVVDPRFRASVAGLAWADLALMMHSMRWALEAGVRRCSFSCLAGNRHTHKLARRVGARVSAISQVYRHPLPTGRVSPPDRAQPAAPRTPHPPSGSRR